MALSRSRSRFRSRSRAPSGSRSSSGDSLRANPDTVDDWLAALVPVELLTLDGRVICIQVDSDASIGQVVSKLKTVSLSLYETYKDAWIVFDHGGKGGSSPVKFDLSDCYVRFMATKLIRKFRHARPDSPLRFQLIRHAVADSQ